MELRYWLRTNGHACKWCDRNCALNQPGPIVQLRKRGKFHRLALNGYLDRPGIWTLCGYQLDDGED